MAALGTVALKLGLSDKEFKTQLNKSVDSVRKSVDQMKNIVLAAQLGNILFSAAQNKMQENLKLVQVELSALSQGITQDMINALKPLIDQFDYIGVGADQAAEALYKFILQGRTMTLNQLGVYVSEDTKALLAGMNAAERYAWALQNIPQHLTTVMEKLDPTTKKMLEFDKKLKDVKETVGMSFLASIMSIVEAFGGLTNVMKTAIVAFTLYKNAMIIGNVAIAISKTLAQGGVFAWPVAIGLGLSALASLLALDSAAGIAVNALNNIPEPGQVTAASQNASNSVSQTVVVVKDRFGETQKMVSERNGGASNNIQTSYGANN